MNETGKRAVAVAERIAKRKDASNTPRQGA
jgi:hypothetical protein